MTTTAEEARTPEVITRALFIAPVLDLAGHDAVRARDDPPRARSRELHHSAYPQLLLGNAALGTVGELWMLALTVLTALNTFNGGFLVASRFIYAAAREGNLPRQFALLNLNAVPWLAVWHLAGASAVVAAVVFATGHWLLLVAVGAAIESAIYALASVCLLVLRRKETRERPFRLVAGRPLADLRGGAVQCAVPGHRVLGPPQRQPLLGRPDRDHPRTGRAVVVYVMVFVPRLRRRPRRGRPRGRRADPSAHPRPGPHRAPPTGPRRGPRPASRPPRPRLRPATPEQRPAAATPLSGGASQRWRSRSARRRR